MTKGNNDCSVVDKDDAQLPLFSMFPDELIELILVEKLRPEWRLVAQFVCQKWCQVIAPSLHLYYMSTDEKYSVKKYFLSCSLCDLTIKGNHLHVFKWAIKNGCHLDEDCIVNVAEKGCLNILQWIKHRDQQLCKWSIWACAGAAMNGHLDVLQWLRLQGCPWDKWTCIHAAGSGHLKVLQWAHEHGCPWDYHYCIQSAKTKGHIDAMKWLQSLNS